MTFEINTQSKSVTIKAFGHTFKEIKNEMRKVLGEDWEDYKLYAGSTITYIPSSYPSYPQPVWYDNSPFIVNPTPILTSVTVPIN